LKRSLSLTLALLASLALTACGNPADPNESASSRFAGYYWAGARQIACYWEGEKRVDLDVKGALYSIAMDIREASDGTVYAVGVYESTATSPIQPCYWRNGEINYLDSTDGSTTGVDAYATGFTLSGNQLYTLGFYYDKDAKNYTACYWEGATFHALKDATGNLLTRSNFAGYSIAVDQGKVYIGGKYWKSTDSLPCYWVDDSIVELTGDAGAALANGQVYGLVADKGTIYAVGSYVGAKGELPCYWKDGVFVALKDASGQLPGIPSDARCIAFLNGTLYIGGSYTDSDSDIKRPCYWEEGSFHALSGGPAAEAYVYSISCDSGRAAFGGICSGTGTAYSFPAYWDAGAYHSLDSGTDDQSSIGDYLQL
jgi:hypothetical protein